MQIEGKIKEINSTEEIGNNGFRKRELVVTTEEQYPQHLLIEFVQDKTNLLDKLEVGQDVKININLRGREWVSPEGETRYFNSIQGWRIEKINNSKIPKIPPAEAFEPNSANDDDNLPF